MPSKINLLNQTFGRLTVKSEAGSRRDSKGRSIVYWICKCSCGNLTEAATGSLRTGHKESCGCLQKEHASKQGKSNFKGEGVAGINSLFTRYKREARYRGLEFLLAKDEFKALISANCHYCGDSPKGIWRREEVNQALSYNGIDRLNNELGYLEDNTVTCCGICNKAKGTLTEEEFVHMAKKIAKRN